MLAWPRRWRHEDHALVSPETVPVSAEWVMARGPGSSPVTSVEGRSSARPIMAGTGFSVTRWAGPAGEQEPERSTNRPWICRQNSLFVSQSGSLRASCPLQSRLPATCWVTAASRLRTETIGEMKSRLATCLPQSVLFVQALAFGSTAADYTRSTEGSVLKLP